jgi:hypothetical protein
MSFKRIDELVELAWLQSTNPPGIPCNPAQGNVPPAAQAWDPHRHRTRTNLLAKSVKGATVITRINKRFYYREERYSI